MRSLAILLLVGCTSTNPVPDATPAGPAEATPAEATAAPAEPAYKWAEGKVHETGEGHAGLVEALGSAGACRSAGMEKPQRVWEWAFEGRAVYAAMCESYAYQADFEWWHQGAEGFVPLKDDKSRAVKLLGHPSFAPSTGHGSWLTKDRGPGDCGDWYLYQLKAGEFIQREHRRRECDDAADNVPPVESWPIAVEAPAPKVAIIESEAALLAMLKGKVEPVINELSGETVGKNVTRSAPGSLAGVPCSAMISVYSDTWGCQTTTEFTHSGYTTKAGWVVFNYGTGHRAGISFSDLTTAVEAMDVQGVPCTNFAHFHADGKLAGCTLAKAHSFGAVKLPTKSDVRVRSDGSVESAFIYEAVEIGGKKVPDGHVELAPDGSVTAIQEGYFGD